MPVTWKGTVGSRKPRDFSNRLQVLAVNFASHLHNILAILDGPPFSKPLDVIYI